MSIAGDASEGLAKLKALRAKTADDTPAAESIDIALEYLSRAYLSDYPFYILEPGELFGLSETPVAEQLDKLLTTVRALALEDVAELAIEGGDRADWPTVWTELLSYAPLNEGERPIDPKDTLVFTTPAAVLAIGAQLSSFAIETLTLTFESDDPKLEATLAALARLPRLSELRLDGTCERMPDGVLALRNLQQLIIDEAGLTDLPANFATLEKLEGLFIQRNAFTRFPEALRAMTHLKTLSIWGNPIAEIPDWIGGLRGLEALLFDRCNLARLPDQLFSLPTLKSLNLSYNRRLTALPDAIGNLPLLEDLTVYQCALTALPESLARIRTLKALRVGENRIHTVPAEIREMPLDYLGLSGNPIRKLPWTKMTYRARRVDL